MQQDMHYYATAVLARAAGFNQADALTIAIADQYVDDAQDGRDILVNGQSFSPLFTANDHGRYLKSRDRDIWRKVYLPFHFLPPGPVHSDLDRFLVAPGGFLVERLLEDLAQEPRQERVYHLCRLGVALHAIADTWSHQNFSGRWHQENDVKELDSLEVPQTLKQALKKALREAFGVINTFTPMPVVHFQAGFLPDYPFLKWRARFGLAMGRGQDGDVLLDNRQQYRQAARFIYDRLAAWPKDQPQAGRSWQELEPDLVACTGYDETSLSARCRRWQETFASLFSEGGLPDYDMHAWESQALGEPLRQDVLDNLLQELGHNHNYPGTEHFAQSAWVQFHKAAARQRAWLGQYVQV